MAKTEAPAPSEKLVEVRLLRNYVPQDPEIIPGTENEPVFVKRFAGEVLSLPRDEAKRVIDLKIAEITADLI
jgi:hypothetical protein